MLNPTWITESSVTIFIFMFTLSSMSLMSYKFGNFLHCINGRVKLNRFNLSNCLMKFISKVLCEHSSSFLNCLSIPLPFDRHLSVWKEFLQSSAFSVTKLLATSSQIFFCFIYFKWFFSRQNYSQLTSSFNFNWATSSWSK